MLPEIAGHQIDEQYDASGKFRPAKCENRLLFPALLRFATVTSGPSSYVSRALRRAAEVLSARRKNLLTGQKAKPLVVLEQDPSKRSLDLRASCLPRVAVHQPSEEDVFAVPS
jgi:hypothetical protein